MLVPPWLNEDVKHDAILIHGTPKIMLHALNADEHLIEMPLVTASRTTAARASGKDLAKLFGPTTNGLIGDDDATLGQKELNIPQTEAEHVIQPDGTADDLAGKAMAVVRVERKLHAANLACLKPDRQTRLT